MPMTAKMKYPFQWVELGRGKVDLPAVFAALDKVRFNGWAVVELDKVPDSSADPEGVRPHQPRLPDAEDRSANLGGCAKADARRGRTAINGPVRYRGPLYVKRGTKLSTDFIGINMVKQSGRTFTVNSLAGLTLARLISAIQQKRTLVSPRNREEKREIWKWILLPGVLRSVSADLGMALQSDRFVGTAVAILFVVSAMVPPERRMGSPAAHHRHGAHGLLRQRPQKGARLLRGLAGLPGGVRAEEP